MNSTDAQQLQLLHQIQNHDMSPLNALILAIILKFPLPDAIFSTQQRLDLFTSISAHSPSTTSTLNSPLAFASLTVFWPLYFIIFLTLGYFLIKGVIYLISNIAPGFLGKFIPALPKTYLEVTFPSDTSKSAYATSQLYTLLHTLAKRNTFWGGLLKQKKTYSLEIVSTKEKGIRYILVANPKDADVFKTSLLSYLPGIRVKEIEDYLDDTEGTFGITELKLSAKFVLPLQKQKILEEHDPISYLTGNMTKLAPKELISFQVITTPILNSIHPSLIKYMNDLRHRMYQGEPLTPALQEGILTKIGSLPGLVVFAFFIKVLFKIFKGVLVFIYSMFLGFLDPNSKTIPFLMTADAISKINTQELLNPYEQELQKSVKEKIDQNLFETSIRILIVAEDATQIERRLSGLLASFGPMSSPYQTLTTKSALLNSANKRYLQFKQRLLSSSSAFNQNPILSTSEISDLYHFPFTDTTKTEDIRKVRSKDLPAPLNLKQENTNLDVIVGVNEYAGEEVPIGLTEEDREKHLYMIGATKTGKSTILANMIYQDIQNGKGIAVIDPHGDLIEKILRNIPQSRIEDVVYLNPDDEDYPVGFNLLSLPTKSNFSSSKEKDFLIDNLISLFQKLYPPRFWGPRMEHILRNACSTALELKDSTIFTVHRLLTDTPYRQQVANVLPSITLKRFWQNEFGKAGDYQQVDMTSPIINKIGKFLDSTVTRNIVGQPISTIDFDEIMNQGKILLVKVSKGELGEDTSEMFGIQVISNIQLAALRRARIPEKQRKPFYLYVDEFQNFATPSFAQILSEARKYRLFATLAHQTTSQIEDTGLLEVILANVGTIVCLRTSNPTDESYILPIFAPTVQKHEISNLPAHHFYIKINADDPEDAFSGTSLDFTQEGTEKTKDSVVKQSRSSYGKSKEVVEKEIEDQLISNPKLKNAPDVQVEAKKEQKTEPKKPEANPKRKRIMSGK